MLDDDDHAVLDAWQLGPVANASVPASGVMNRTVLLTIARGQRVVLRAYRHENRERVEWEHTVLAHARANGLIEAVGPIPLPGTGGTIVERDGRFFALFPHAPGRQSACRDALSPHAIAAMGRFLARVHEALATFPVERSPRWLSLGSQTLDARTTLARLGNVEAVIQQWPTFGDMERRALALLAEQRRWLEQEADRTPTSGDDLRDVPVQLVHGDYQETNVFLDETTGEVSALIDWDKATVAPRLYEVVRALHLMLGLAPAASCTFVRAYQAASGAPFENNELRRVARAYGRMRDHDLWVFEEGYAKNDARVRSLLGLSRFVAAPFAPHWQSVEKALENVHSSESVA